MTPCGNCGAWLTGEEAACPYCGIAWWSGGYYYPPADPGSAPPAAETAAGWAGQQTPYPGWEGQYYPGWEGWQQPGWQDQQPGWAAPAPEWPPPTEQGWYPPQQGWYPPAQAWGGTSQQAWEAPPPGWEAPQEPGDYPPAWSPAEYGWLPPAADPEPPATASWPSPPPPSAPLPAPPPVEAHPTKPRSTLAAPGRILIAACYVLVVGLVLAAIGLVAANRQGGTPVAAEPLSSSGGATGAPASCSAPPRVQVRSAEIVPGGLRARVVMTTSCSRDQLLDGSAVQVRLLGQNSYQVAAGTFDFSTTPVLIPAGAAASATLVYPVGTFVATNYGFLTGECSATTSAATGSVGSTSVTVTATSSATASAQSAREALQRQLRLDAPDVSALAGSWVAQISSKRPGLVVDGVEYGYPEILADHMALRAQYPQARLLWSGDFSSYTSNNFYVTVLAVRFPTPEAALSWCEQAHRDADHCFAKLISRTAGPDGATRYQE